MTELLIVLLVVVIAARFVGELMERAGQLAILGELLAGIVLGILITYGPVPQLAGLVEDSAFQAIASLGMLFLMLMVGMEMDVDELIKASKTGLVVAVGGIVLPLILGYVIGLIFIPESEYKFIHCSLLGVVLSITAVPALSRVLVDLKLLNTKLGHTIMNAAIVDDIIGLLLLAMLTTLMIGGEVPAIGELLLMVAKVLGFFVLALIIGKFVMPYIGMKLEQVRSREIEFSFVLIIAVGFGIIAEYAGMHFIIGALVAGMFIREGALPEEAILDLENKISGIALGFLAPIFFVSIGLHVDLSALGTAPLFVLAVLVAAVVGKVVGCGVPARLAGFSMRESLAIGVGMNGRGAVEIIVAAVALEAGIFALPVPTPPLVTSMFSSIVIMAIVTTLIVPMGMRFFMKS